MILILFIRNICTSLSKDNEVPEDTSTSGLNRNTYSWLLADMTMISDVKDFLHKKLI